MLQVRLDMIMRQNSLWGMHATELNKFVVALQRDGATRAWLFHIIIVFTGTNTAIRNQIGGCTATSNGYVVTSRK